MHVERRRRGVAGERAVGSVVQRDDAGACVRVEGDDRVRGPVADRRRPIDENVAGVEGAGLQKEGVGADLQRRGRPENHAVDREVRYGSRSPAGIRHGRRVIVEAHGVGRTRDRHIRDIAGSGNRERAARAPSGRRPVAARRALPDEGRLGHRDVRRP